MDGALFWSLAVLATVFIGMSKGGLPMAGTVAVPILSLAINPIVAAGLLLPVYIISDMFGLYAYRHEFSRRVVSIVVAGAMVGIGVGWGFAVLATGLDEERWVKLLVGVIGLAFVLNQLLRHRYQGAPKPANLAPGLFWGAVTGFTSFVSHSGGPPYQVYTLPMKMTRTLFAGTTTVTFAVINAVKLIPYYFLGQLNLHNLEIAALLALPAAASVFLGMWLVKVMSDKLYYRIINTLLAALSVKLIWDAL